MVALSVIFWTFNQFHYQMKDLYLGIFFPVTIQAFAATQGNFFKENTAVLTQSQPKAENWAGRAVRAFTCTGGTRGRGEPELITTSIPSATQHSPGPKAPSSFPDLLLGEVTGELHLPGTSDTKQLHHPWMGEWTQCGQIWGSKTDPLESGNGSSWHRNEKSLLQFKYCPWDGENSVLARDRYFTWRNSHFIPKRTFICEVRTVCVKVVRLKLLFCLLPFTPLNVLKIKTLSFL